MSHSPIPPSSIPKIIQKYKVQPKKGKGQNFLFDDEILSSITRASGILPNDTVLEIGPGLGSLTRHLVGEAAQVVAVEVDAGLVSILQKEFINISNITIIQGDILDIDPADHIRSNEYLVVANIPYNITSLIIRHLLNVKIKPKRIIITIQKEVAHRICAHQGKMSLLALSVQIFGTPSIVFNIPASSFFPVPEVDSSVIRIDIHPKALVPPQQMNDFFRLAKAGFSQKRKTLLNSLAPLLGRSNAEKFLIAAGINPSRRPETLNINEWLVLCEQVAGK